MDKYLIKYKIIYIYIKAIFHSIINFIHNAKSKSKENF